ncbi:nucleoid occlusion protein [Alkalibacter saccharofermentans]|uniref:Chromosome partitioning protein, ParB family n=1 Tax=Alkalibacter saccharofermentans DSM 14828 TaxID=1120975 RepID=A0A1M4T5Z2_9FIRM|nr:nucleoid occlusion protein [Alkalibacter saccharofermentans]SHE39718.1 chromosome partitioning protein, ParB family [Alkalibacter saccharofermentans DSM 14828]
MSDGMKIQYVDIDCIRPNPYQPRTRFSNASLEELAISIKSYGVLQPISVRKFSEKNYELIAGERRLRASKLAGLKEIPVIVSDIVDVDSATIALIENIQREDLDFIEEAESYQQLISLHGMTQEQIAKKVGKNQSTIANKLRLLRLNPSVREIIFNNELSERHARALLKIPDEELQLMALKKIISSDLNVKKTEELIEKIRDEILINNFDEPITHEKKARVKSFINMRIYTNTIKKAYEDILKTGIDASYVENDQDEYLEVKIKIKKNR